VSQSRPADPRIPHRGEVERLLKAAGKSRASGARNRTAACTRSNACKWPIAPTWTKACSFSNSLGTRKGCLRSRSRAKNVDCSISCYRTAPGRMARWSPPSANRLICWRKRPLPRHVPGRVRRQKRLKPRFGALLRHRFLRFCHAKSACGRLHA
jgi:hypothetical protein